MNATGQGGATPQNKAWKRKGDGNKMTEQERFEKWARTEYKQVKRTAFGYTDSDISVNWACWKAAIESKTEPKQTAIDRLRAGINCKTISDRELILGILELADAIAELRKEYEVKE